MKLCVVLMAIVWSQVAPATSQDLPTRKPSAWDGRDTGSPAQRWTPGIEQQESKRQQEILHGWKDAERRSYETRVTPEHWLRGLQEKIQQTHAASDYASEAAAWSNLAETIQAPGFAPYSQGLDVWSCYKGEVGARLAHIAQVHQRDPGMEQSEWDKVLPLAKSLSVHDPSDPHWPYLVGASYLRSGPSSFNTARQWLIRCMNLPSCQPDLKAKCQSALAEMKAEEDRLRREAEEKAARERAEAEVRAKAREKARLVEQENNKLADTLKLAESYIMKDQNQQAITLLNEIINAHPKGQTRILGSAYLYRATIENGRRQYQQAFDDCNSAQAIGFTTNLVEKVKREAQAGLRH